MLLLRGLDFGSPFAEQDARPGFGIDECLPLVLWRFPEGDDGPIACVDELGVGRGAVEDALCKVASSAVGVDPGGWIGWWGVIVVDYERCCQGGVGE